MVTAIAFVYFARHNCDIVVCEVGMGGEFDATNVIPAPEAAVFCNIGLDHTQYLGDTIEKIAATKAGIIKPGCDAVLYRQSAAVEEIIRQRCERLGVPLHLADFDGIRPESAGLEGQVFDWEDLDGLRLPLLGRHQLCNAAVALTAIRVLQARGWAITDSAISAGGWPPPTGPAGSRSSAGTRCSSSTAATIPSASRPWSRTSGTICPVGP
ncbi:MAG: Mur ligase family protein [Oscillospiraceae bacterium]